MTSTSDDLLRQIVTGELGVADALVVERSREDSDFAAAVQELERVRRDLDAVGRFDREVAADAIDSKTKQDLVDVQASLGAALGPRQRRASLRRWVPLAAAALALVLSLVWWTQRSTTDTAPQWSRLLGTSSDMILAPSGEVSAFATLEVDYDRLQGVRNAKVEVISMATGEVLARRSGIESTAWSFTVEEKRALTRARHVGVRLLVTLLVGEEEEFTAQAKLVD